MYYAYISINRFINKFEKYSINDILLGWRGCISDNKMIIVGDILMDDTLVELMSPPPLLNSVKEGDKEIMR